MEGGGESSTGPKLFSCGFLVIKRIRSNTIKIFKNIEWLTIHDSKLVLKSVNFRWVVWSDFVVVVVHLSVIFKSPDVNSYQLEYLWWFIIIVCVPTQCFASVLGRIISVCFCILISLLSFSKKLPWFLTHIRSLSFNSQVCEKTIKYGDKFSVALTQFLNLDFNILVRKTRFLAMTFLNHFNIVKFSNN